MHVRGQDFDLEATCLFRSLTTVDEILVRPIWVNKELMLCEVPRHEPETFAFDLLWADGAYNTSSNQTFMYYPDPHATSIYPAHVTLRAHRLGVNVRISGYHFLNTSETTSRIGAIHVENATYMSPLRLDFRPPPILEPGSYRVEVSLNTIDYSLAASPVTLTYHGDFMVIDISLDRVQQSLNDNINIDVVGSGFPKSTSPVHFYCIFDPYYDSLQQRVVHNFTRVVLNATLSADGTWLRCPNIPTYFPDLGITDYEFNVTLSFSFDEQELQWNQTLFYYPPIELDRLEPNILSLTQALTINVFGQDLVDSGDELACRMSRLAVDQKSKEPFIADASAVLWYSKTQVQCTFAHLKQGTYNFSLAINGLQYVSINQTVKVIPGL